MLETILIETKHDVPAWWHENSMRPISRYAKINGAMYVNGLKQEIVNWMNDNQLRYSIRLRVIEFYNEEDLVMFKLRWM